MLIRYLLLLSISIAISIAEIKKICVCGTQRIPCACPSEQTDKFKLFKNRVFRVFSVPSAPAPRPIPPQYFVLTRNIQSAAPTQNFNPDQPIGYVLTTSPAEAFYLDSATGQLIPTTRPRGFQGQNTILNPTIQQPPQFAQQFIPPSPPSPPSTPLTTASRPSLLVSGGTPSVPFRNARMIQHPTIPLYPGNPGVSSSFNTPPPSIPLLVSAPYYPPQPQQPQLQFRTAQSQQSRTPAVLGTSEPNLVPVSQLTRIVKKQRHAKKLILDKPRPGDVEDFSFVDGGNSVIEENDIDRKYKSFVAGAPPSASIGEPAEVVRTRPRSLLETLPSGLIAKVANKLASKLPPPKFSFSIKPSKSSPNFH